MGCFDIDYSVLKKSVLFRNIPAKDVRDALDNTPHYIKHFEKEKTIFHLMDPADRIGIVLEGSIQAQKSFTNGRRMNVSVRIPGELIGAAAVFSVSGKYPCDLVTLDPVTVLVFKKEDFLQLIQRNLQIMENFITEISSAAFMLHQKMELLSYTGIAQKAAFWLLMQEAQTGKEIIPIPGSVTKWAMLMNVSRTSLHRELKRLSEEGLIRYSPPVIEVLDVRALRKMLDQ